MGKTETLFAGVLIAAIVLAVSLVLFRGDGSAIGHTPNTRWDTSSEKVLAGFTGAEREDLCTCYEQAYGYAAGNLSIQSLEYKGGFAECSRRLGTEGGRAWTDGWANGERAPSAPRSCRAWFAAERY